MNTTRRSFFRMVATTNNQTLYTRNLPVFDEDGEPLAKVGQPVLFDPRLNLSLDETDLPNYETFELGVVIMNNRGDKKMITVDGTDWNMCRDSFTVSHTLPECACPQKADLYFRCVSPYKGYSINVRYRSPLTKAQYGGDGDGIDWQFNWAKGHKSWDCSTCDEPTISAWEVACGLKKEVTTSNEVKYLEQVGKVNTGEQVFMPIKANALPYGKPWLKICLSPGNTSCNTCNILGELKTLTVVNVEGEGPEAVTTTHDIDLQRFNNNGITDTKIMLKKVYKYLEKELDKINVGVHVSGGNGNCCDYEIELGGCATSATLTSVINGSDTTVAFTAHNPWSQAEDNTSFKWTHGKKCQPCNAEGETYYPEAVIRFYPENITTPCGCYDLPGNNMVFTDFYNQIVEVHGIEGFDPDKTGFHIAQEQKYPVNSGYHFLNKVYEQSLGYRGAQIFQGGGFYGEFPEQPFNHQLYEAMWNIKCATDYCNLNIIARKQSEGMPYQNSQQSFMESESLLLIPKTDIATYDSIRPIFDYIASLGRCNKLTGGCFVLPTAIAITQGATASVADGATLQLGLTPTPVGASEAGTWTSATPSVATVSSSGLVTGISAGTAVITFTPSYGTATPDTITITVTP